MEPETAKPKCHCVCRKFVVAIVVILIIGAICCHVHRPRSHWGDPKPGTFCTVQFNNNTVSPLVDISNGARVTVSGELVAIRRDAILLKTFREGTANQVVDELVWIPKSSILLIKYKEE